MEASINTEVGINVVDIDGQIQINATTIDILKLQKVDGSTLYESLELSFDTVDKTSMFKISNVDILASLRVKNFCF